MWRIAVHECGHAILAVDRVLGDITEVRVGRRDGRTTITPDLGAGLPRDHRELLAYTLGGRAAELVIFGSVGSGSGGSAPTCDLAYATQIAVQMETAFGCGMDGLVWSPGDIGARITDPVLRAKVQTQLETAEWSARRVLEAHKVLLLEMSKDLLRHRILEGEDLQVWIDRITGDRPWDPEDPSGRKKAATDAPMVSGGNVIRLQDHRMDAPS
jgi:ATP-dependent Zn protease